MMTGAEHGHHGGHTGHEQVNHASPCHHSAVDETRDNHQSGPDAESLVETDSNHDSDEMVSCGMCALCTSIVPDIDVSLKFSGKSVPGNDLEMTALYSKTISSLDRPPRH